MATLTPADFTLYKRALRNDPVAKAEMRTLSPGKLAWMAAFQALENGYVGERANFKSLMEAAIGKTITNALAVKFEKVWMQNKARGL